MMVPRTFHDWEFQPLKLYEDAIRAKTKTTTKGDKTIDPHNSDDSHAEAASPTRAAAETPVPAEDRPDMEAEAAASQGGPPLRPRSRAPKSFESGSVRSATAAAPMDETTSYAIKARTEMVHKVPKGLREEAFELARDIGIGALTAPGGLRLHLSHEERCVPTPCRRSSRAFPVESSDIRNAYFRAEPIDRVVLMRQPSGGLPGIDPEPMLLIRVPVKGLATVDVVSGAR